MKPHKHAEIIKAWADGAEIQVKSALSNEWVDVLRNFTWSENYEYRIKPEEKKPVVRWLWASKIQDQWSISVYFHTEKEAKQLLGRYRCTKLEYTRTEFPE